jgi:hypothetical protein
MAGQTSSLIIRDGEISNNHAQGGGGVAIYQGSNFTLLGGIINDNTANIAGGGILAIQDSVFTMKGGLIRGNRSSGSGGGIALMERSVFVLEDGEILLNVTEEHGGGIAADDTGIITVQGGFISSNHAAGRGGGIFTAGPFVKTAGKIYGSDMPEDAANTAPSGAAIFIFRNDGEHKTLETSAGENLNLDAAGSEGWGLFTE